MAYPAGIVAESSLPPRVFSGPKAALPAATLAGLRLGDIFCATDATVSADSRISMLGINGTTRAWYPVYSTP